jgi:SAM-dependent methyltransferase
MASRKLHLGCGTIIKKGWLNTDILSLPGVDMVLDLEKTPYPFADNSFDEVEGHHLLEHLQNFTGCMEELGRICANDATLRFSVPYFASPAFWRDPTHKRPFNIDTFSYFNGSTYGFKTNVQVVRRRLFYFSCRSFMKSRWYSWPMDFLINLSPVLYQRFFVYLLPASELHFELRVIKDVAGGQLVALKKGKKKK